MARPIKETPILYGEDAQRLLEAMKNVVPETPEKMAEVLASTNILVGGFYDFYDAEDALEWLAEEYKYIDPAEFVPSWEEKAE